ncbi:MAG: (d)CMP kinase [Anaerolineales bacterium]
MSSASMIAIDGPAASGKSTLAQRLAARLGHLYFDTGVMYRAVTLAALRREVSIEDESTVTEIAISLNIDVRPPSIKDGRKYDVLLGGEDITWDIRLPEVDANVSQVSMYPGVRQAMTQRQREIGLRGKVVMVGRDIGTVVLPEADLKIYLDASDEARALRRYLENQERGGGEPYRVILCSMRDRDRIDSTRDLAPLRAASDAIVLDTTELDADQVFKRILKMALD